MKNAENSISEHLDYKIFLGKGVAMACPQTSLAALAFGNRRSCLSNAKVRLMPCLKNNAPVNVNPHSPNLGNTGTLVGTKINVRHSIVPQHVRSWMTFASLVSEPVNFFAGGLESRAVPHKRLGLN